MAKQKRYPWWEVSWEEWIYVNEKDPDRPRWTRQREIVALKRDAQELAYSVSRGSGVCSPNPTQRIRITPLVRAAAGETVKSRVHLCRECGRVHVGECRHARTWTSTNAAMCRDPAWTTCGAEA